MTLSRRSVLQSIGLGAASLAVPSFGRRAQAAAPGPAPVLHRFHIGDATVTALLDGHLALPTAAFTGSDPAAVEAALAGTLYQAKDGGVEIPVNGYLVERGGKYTLIDTGTAQLMGPDLGGLSAALAASGVAAADISTVLLTHMHPDHAGGLLAADGSAAFPNAELVIAETEWGFWQDDAIMASVPADAQGFFQMARNTTAPYADRLKLFSGEVEAAPGFTAVPLPGHTPGHSGFMLDGGDTQLLIWGDIVHSTALQFPHPEWTIPFDVDQALAAQTRKAMFERAAADQLLVTGMHIDFPGLGQVAREGDSFAFHQAPWQFGI